MICIECGKSNSKFLFKPKRHITSPNCYPSKLSNGKENRLIFCSIDCYHNFNKESNIFFAELDKNCSDCKNFESEKSYNNIRFGIYRKTFRTLFHLDFPPKLFISLQFQQVIEAPSLLNR